MKRLGLALLMSTVIILAMVTAALAAVRRIDFASYVGAPDAAVTSGTTTSVRLAFLNQTLYPDNAIASSNEGERASRLEMLNEAVSPDSIWTDHIVIIDPDSWRIT